MLKVNNKLVPIGYWRETENGKLDLPWPKKGNLSIEIREMVAKYLDSGKEYTVWRGYSKCRICGKLNGTVCMTDGEFTYPEGYAHYILDHNIQPDKRLLQKVLSK